jgi:mRNA-degrading endonuclease RelE of RelBE toxin-antitoxin system
MDRITKALLKLTDKEKSLVKDILLKIKQNSLSGFDLKKLKSRDDIFRIRKGKLRIIFRKLQDNQYFILSIEKRLG